MKTTGHQFINESVVSFEEMGADLHALYSGSNVTVQQLAIDLQALYGSTPLPVSQSDLLAEMRELYGDDEVSWSDFSRDFEGLYVAHAV
ncbi:hypothetical protein [Candidatus Oscillochloris fontis]|uniref:hypothetical protein n=1 Tax=Candidatus Oscillochloris fontis TaxID=2496868 RepID=UPI00101D6A22|nr:hypothetical protein [Candidatus Oscillochloris fontis]